MADGVVILPSYHEAIKDLSDKERLQMYDAMVRYGLYGEIVDLPPVLRSMFTLIKPNIDASQNRHRAAKANGEKGGAPHGNQNARKKQPENNQRNNQSGNQRNNQDIDIDLDSDFDKEVERDSKGETRPLPVQSASEEEWERKRQTGLDALETLIAQKMR